MYTYFIISPGAEPGSYVQYKSAQGNYIKFGEAKGLKEGAGVRNAYLTHNPDIGVAALMDSTVFVSPYLGTQLKNYIIEKFSIEPVGSTEWFSVEEKAAWGLFKAMTKWDKAVLTLADLDTIQAAIAKYLS